jgi:hypothetical protein
MKSLLKTTNLKSIATLGKGGAIIIIIINIVLPGWIQQQTAE